MPKPAVTLVPWDPNSPEHVERMVEQRIICGWQASIVPTEWKDEHINGTKCLYWIIFPQDEPQREKYLKMHIEAYPKEAEELLDSSRTLLGKPRIPTHAKFLPVGHVALDTHISDYAENVQLDFPKSDAYWVKSLYVSYRLQGLGIGGAAMKIAERVATEEPLNARHLLLDTVHQEDQANEEFAVAVYGGAFKVPTQAWSTIKKVTAGYVAGLVFNYSVGVTITIRFLGDGYEKLVSEVELSIVAFIYAVFAIALAIAVDAVMSHLWWAAKWTAVQKADLSVKDVRRILRSDSALSAMKSLLVGPMRARLVALFYFALRLGPPFGFSLLFGGYTVQCDQEGEAYPWLFRVHTNNELLGGGAALALGLPLLCSVILILCSRKVDAVPRSILAIAVSLFKLIQPLQQHGTMASAKTIVKKLNTDQRFRAVRSDIDGQIILEFAPCEPCIPQASDDAAAQALVLSTQYKGSFLLSHTKRLVLPMACSLLFAVGIQVWMQTVNVRGRDDDNVCLPMDQILGYPGARIALNILVILYGISTGAAFEQMMHLYRWSVFHHNPVDLIQLENLFQGHFLFSYWNFRHLPILGGRAFTTGMLSTLATRLCVGFIPPLALLTGWDSGQRSSKYRDAIFALTWITFSLMLLSGLAVLLSTRRDYVPDDDPIIAAVVMQDLIGQLHQTNRPACTDAIKMGSIHLNDTVDAASGISILRVSVQQQVEAFKLGLYI
ncbi:hypothetical protein FGADI_4357 [Fusarium gaditjirri]|uniref:Uncharacterized protein n=1 Tax=Fusarium gaditjirri TaxID=282569 RepID=A0A8H4TDA1_9HYPO|nr:hypothetical protein FGADI_4357 [Fusarium gaditjirri]